MSDSRTGEFKLKRQKAGVGYFGQVRVRVAEGTDSVSWQADPADTSSLQPGVSDDDEFITAALAGAGDGLHLVAGAGVDVTGWAVEVVHVQLNYTDIEASAVRAAAALAVAAAFGVEERMELDFDSGWVVRLSE
jgi:hypothetical protein